MQDSENCIGNEISQKIKNFKPGSTDEKKQNITTPKRFCSLRGQLLYPSGV